MCSPQKLAGERWPSPGDFAREYCADPHHKLQHVYGRPARSDAPQERQPSEDVLGFILSTTPSEFFGFLELTFRTSPMWRMLSDENELVDATGDIFRAENALYQLTRMVKVEQHDPTHDSDKAGP